jgi:hypothetical protein
MAASIEGFSGRFLWPAGGGRHGGDAGVLGSARDDLERRRKATAGELGFRCALRKKSREGKRE